MDLSHAKEAERLLRAGQKCYPGDFWINSKLGLVLMKMRRTQAAEAVRFMSAALAIRPHSPVICLNLGACSRMRGDSRRPCPVYRRAIELKPNYADAHNNLGIVLCKGGSQRKGRRPSAEPSNSIPITPRWTLISAIP